MQNTHTGGESWFHRRKTPPPAPRPRPLLLASHIHPANRGRAASTNEKETGTNVWGRCKIVEYVLITRLAKQTLSCVYKGLTYPVSLRLNQRGVYCRFILCCIAQSRLLLCPSPPPFPSGQKLTVWTSAIDNICQSTAPPPSPWIMSDKSTDLSARNGNVNYTRWWNWRGAPVCSEQQ